MTELTREDEYIIILKHLGSITSLRKFADQQNFNLLEEISNKFIAIIAERREEEELRQLELQELEEKRLKALEYLESIGLSPDELKVSVFENAPKRKKKSKGSTTRKAKYAHTDEQGKTHYWTGVGRISNYFKDLTDKGHDLEEFLIEETRDAVKDE
ncbi:H-NS family nucleoid-associated regulatory protein (plasmid) [Citrobacter freundii]|uniref:DNA-binding protein StpA n=6 Tax=Enterobacterales TaxID=91347 RepID=A0A384ZT73_ECOLX|nr:MULTISPECIES: H-NS family nucleoid-associated regulatory protein [Enterobacterales]AGT26766.1 DNA-bending protein with chaperone activity [Klebsiella pneumoniae JM45]AHG50705.1 H-NS family protein [Klebsiella pneumoniae]ALK43898.1 DNA-bending protein with chaperone activity [Enterobacter cloacae]ASK03915.1 DNA-binding protein [Citrobacter freundii]AVA18246.1 HN-S family DNA-binding protein [Citrobacter freundii]